MEYNETGPNAKCSLHAIFHYFCASLRMKIIYSSVKNKYNYLIIYILYVSSMTLSLMSKTTIKNFLLI